MWGLGLFLELRFLYDRALLHDCFQRQLLGFQMLIAHVGLCFLRCSFILVVVVARGVLLLAIIGVRKGHVGVLVLAADRSLIEQTVCFLVRGNFELDSFLTTGVRLGILAARLVRVGHGHLLLVLGKLQVLVLIHPHKPLLVLLLLQHHLLLQIGVYRHAWLLGIALRHLLHRVSVVLHHVTAFA